MRQTDRETDRQEDKKRKTDRQTYNESNQVLDCLSRSQRDMRDEKNGSVKEVK